MKIGINLASNPYENLRPYYTAAGAGAVLLAILALFVGARERQTRFETRSMTQQRTRFEREFEAFQRERRELEEWLTRPEVQEVSDHSAFLNSLILRKSLSWTRMFLDLEKILPAKTQVVSIRPRLNRSQQAELRLAVTANEMAPLVELLKNLESSPEFGTPAVESQRVVSDKPTENHITLELNTQYRPSPQTSPSAPALEDAAESETSTTVADAAARHPKGGP